MTVKNHRVGYGGGFYDRFLEKHPDILSGLQLPLISRSWIRFPHEPTDICPQIIVTQSNIYRNAFYRREDL